MTCQATQGVLHDYLHRELDGAQVEEVKTHLESCEDCRKRLEFARVFRSFLQEKAQAEEVPAELKSRIQAALRTVPQVVPLRPRVTTLTPFQNALALVASLAVALAVTVTLMTATGGRQPQLLAALVGDHNNCSKGVPAECVMLDPLADLQTAMSDKMHVKVDLPPIPANYKLSKSRVCIVHGMQVGHLVLTRDQQPVSLFVMDNPKMRSCRVQHFLSRHGQHFAGQAEGKGVLLKLGSNTSLWVVGDGSPDHLEPVVASSR